MNSPDKDYRTVQASSGNFARTAAELRKHRPVCTSHETFEIKTMPRPRLRTSCLRVYMTLTVTLCED